MSNQTRFIQCSCGQDVITCYYCPYRWSKGVQRGPNVIPAAHNVTQKWVWPPYACLYWSWWDGRWCPGDLRPDWKGGWFGCTERCPTVPRLAATSDPVTCDQCDNRTPGVDLPSLVSCTVLGCEHRSWPPHGVFDSRFWNMHIRSLLEVRLGCCSSPVPLCTNTCCLLTWCFTVMLQRSLNFSNSAFTRSPQLFFCSDLRSFQI